MFCFVFQFTNRTPDDSKTDRDVFNERPSKEEVLAATQIQTEKRVRYSISLKCDLILLAAFRLESSARVIFSESHFGP